MTWVDEVGSPPDRSRTHTGRKKRPARIKKKNCIRSCHGGEEEPRANGFE